MIIPEQRQHQLSRARFGSGRLANGVLVRGVVLRTYFPDDIDRNGVALRPPGFVCDVLVYEIFRKTVLRQVPIAVMSGGVNDHEIWRPRGSSVDLTSGPVNVNGGPNEQFTSAAEDLDGDHVLIGFLGNDLQKPIILQQIPHPRTTRAPSVGDTTQYKYRRVIRGSVFGVRASGDLDLDTSQASAGDLTVPGGTEVPNPAAGNVRITVPALAVVSITNAIVSNPRNVVLSNLLVDLGNALQEISTILTPINMGVPPPVTTALATALVAGGQAYQSTKLETD